jgi:hypothetical protein
MDFEEYRRAYFVDPPPEPRFRFDGVRGATLYFSDYEEAVAYYTEVLGAPEYVEGAGTRGWRVGDSWLTLLAGGDGAPRNTEIGIVVDSPAEAEALQAAFVAAGGTGAEPSDQLMYRPIRACPVTDPFGTEILIHAPSTAG